MTETPGAWPRWATWQGHHGGVDRSLAGRLLVATPQIDSGVFHEAVVLMLQHDGDGAQGIVINRPMGAPVDAVLPGWQAHVTAPDRLFHGGPVSLDSAIGLVAMPATDPEPSGTRRLFGGVGLLDLDTPPTQLAGECPGVRIFAGYAGWDVMQVESEIARGDWFVVDAQDQDPFSDEPRTLWSRVLRRQGGQLAWVAFHPGDPELN